MTKEELIRALSQKSDITQEQAVEVVNIFTDEIKKELKDGKKVTIAGFGTFILSGGNKDQ